MDNNNNDVNKTILFPTSNLNNNKKNLVYTNIHTYKEKRRNKNNSKTTNIIFYNKESHRKLQDYAFHNDTDVSSIISNVVDELVKGLDEKPITLDPFIDPDYIPTPELEAEKEKVIDYLERQDSEKLKDLESRFYQYYTYSVAFAQMNKTERKEKRNDYLYLYQKYIYR